MLHIHLTDKCTTRSTSCLHAYDDIVIGMEAMKGVTQIRYSKILYMETV